jgi:hypothetical protein
MHFPHLLSSIALVAPVGDYSAMRDRGHEIAAWLGAPVEREYHDGQDSSVYLLADGRILKITDSACEAALCLNLKDIQTKGYTHPSVPTIGSVLWVASPDDPDSFYYIILRDDFTEFDWHEVDGEIWSDSLFHVSTRWRREDYNGALRATTGLLEPYGALARDVLIGLEWILMATGVKVSDIRSQNVGVSPSGRAGLRDLGRCLKMPQILMKRVVERDFEQLPREVLTDPALIGAALS